MSILVKDVITISKSGAMAIRVRVIKILKEELREPLFDILAHDPRPSYHHSEEREYGMNFFGYNVRFKVLEDSIVEIIKIF